MKLTKLASTGNYSKLYIKGHIVWFSYETPIALYKEGVVYVTENEWGQTTGKHINKVKHEYVLYTVIPHSELLSLLDIYI